MQEIIQKAKAALLAPKTFFPTLKKEQGLKPAITYFAVLSLLSSILSVLALFLTSPDLVSKNDISPTLFGPSLVIGYFLNLGLTFIVAGILHLWIRLFKGDSKFTKTYQLYIYSRTPSLILGWIPFVSLFAWFYGFYLLVLGTQEIYKLPQRKTVIMYVLPALIITLVTLVLSYLAFSQTPLS